MLMLLENGTDPKNVGPQPTQPNPTHSRSPGIWRAEFIVRSKYPDLDNSLWFMSMSSSFLDPVGPIALQQEKKGSYELALVWGLYSGPTGVCLCVCTRVCFMSLLNPGLFNNV